MYALAVVIVKMALQATVIVYAAIAKGIVFIARAALKAVKERRA